MKGTVLSSHVLFALLLWAALGSAARASHAVVHVDLGLLKLDELRKGCGCMFSKADDPDYYYLEAVMEKEYDGKPRMRIDGKLVEPTVVSSNKGPLSKEKKDDRFTDQYEIDETQIQLDATVVETCPKLTPTCDRNKYVGVLKITRGRSQEMIPVKGHCGC